MRQLTNRSLQWLYRCSDALLKDAFAEQLFGAKIFFFTFGGALVGGAIERGANTVAGFWSTIDTTFLPDTISVILVVLAGILFALIGKEIEIVDVYVERRDDRDSLSPRELKRYRDKEEKKRYPKVKCYFLCACVLLVATLPILLIGHKLPVVPEHPVIHLQCNPCTITVGDSANLDWDVDRAAEAFLNGDRVPVCGSRVVKPEQSTTYHLRAVGPDGKAETSITVRVQEPPTPTSTPKPSPSPTSADISELTPTRETTSP